MNTTGELLHNQRYNNDEGISIVDHILNSCPQCVLQPNGLLVATDMEVAEQSDHIPIWVPYTVLGGRGTQGRVHKGKATKRQIYYARNSLSKTRKRSSDTTTLCQRNSPRRTYRTWIQLKSSTTYRNWAMIQFKRPSQTRSTGQDSDPHTKMAGLQKPWLTWHTSEH